MTKTRPCKQVRSAPLSLRVSDQERAALVHLADGRPLSAFVRERLFELLGDDAGFSISAKERKVQLAKALQNLGTSDLARSLRVLAGAAEDGRLELDGEIRAELLAALQAIQEMRGALLQGLGLRRKEGP